MDGGRGRVGFGRLEWVSGCPYFCLMIFYDSFYKDQSYQLCPTISCKQMKEPLSIKKSSPTPLTCVCKFAWISLSFPYFLFLGSTRKLMWPIKKLLCWQKLMRTYLPTFYLCNKKKTKGKRRKVILQMRWFNRK